MTLSRQQMESVSDLMTGDIIALQSSDTVARAVQILTDFTLHLLPVVDGPEAKGTITLSDCHGFSPTTVLSDVIRRSPVVVDVSMPSTEAASLMRSEGIHHLLVTEDVAGTRELVGVLSSLDLLKLVTAPT